MKKYIGLLLAVLLLLSLFAACGKKDEFKTTSSIWYYGNTESKDPLRICVDIQESTFEDDAWNRMEAQKAMDEFLSVLRTNLGVQDIVIEFIPNNWSDNESTARRASAVSRLRVEMLAGGGPDVFIMRYNKTVGPMGWNLDAGDVLFKTPQKVMDSGIFLPLDEYIEIAQYADWESFPNAIIEAGRNDEGQQIVPISYTLPVMLYPKEVFDYTPDRLLTWNDMLTDPELSPFATDLINCIDYDAYKTEDGSFLVTNRNEYLEYILGVAADYEKGELLFTEEELLQRVQEILSMDPEDTQPDGQESQLNIQYRSTMETVTLLPIYSDDGGITARIENYAAINRNTDRPEEAFAVIDTLLSAKAQQEYLIFSTYLCDSSYSNRFPVGDAQYKVGTTLSVYSNEENYAELCELREQITGANFDGETGAILSNVLSKSFAFPDELESIVHEAYVELERRVRE